MYIQMDSAECEAIHRDKSEHAYAELLIVDNNDTVYDGYASVKTRGNTTWAQFKKKPYSIKFKKRQQFFHLEKGKSFVLLHNSHRIGGIIQNTIAFELGRRLGLHAPQTPVFIRVYVNNDYRGLYLMSNKVENGVMGLNINDINKQNKQLNSLPLKDFPTIEKGEPFHAGYRRGVCLDAESEDYTGGYLLDVKGPRTLSNDIAEFVSDSGTILRVREPKYASVKEVDYIADYYNYMESAVCAPNGIHPTTGVRYDEYMDVASFVKCYILQELLVNGDAGRNSFYMYKDADSIDGKMYASPLWDFDWCSRKNGHDLYACGKQRSSRTYHTAGGLLYMLWGREDFRQKAMHAYDSILYPEVQDMLLSGYIDSLRELLYEEVLADSLRWKEPWRESIIKCFDGTKERLYQRSEFLRQIWSEDSTKWICVTVHGGICPRDVYSYALRTEGFHLPYTKYEDPQDPSFTYYDAATGDELLPDTILYSNHEIVLRKKSTPSRIEVLRRRAVIKIRKYLQ